MREQGGGMLLSQMIERPKLTGKVTAAAESNDNKTLRRLSNGGSTFAQNYGGSILQTAGQAGMQQRLKGGSVGAVMLPAQRHSTMGLHDLSAVERIKDLKARLEPLLRPIKPAHSPSPPPPPPPPPPHPPLDESSSIAPSLPQWGLGKRRRRSRLEAFKLNVATAPAKHLPLRTVDEAVNTFRVHGWSHPTSAFMDSDASKGATTAARNGGSGRAATNGCSSARQGDRASARHGDRICGDQKSGGWGPSSKGEPSISATRQRSEGSAEVPIANNHSNGHMVGTMQSSRATAATMEAATSSVFLHAKSRSELQTFEWPRILIGLSRKEKEDDFLLFKGSKLPQRPKKRPKVVERALHYCTPGNTLCDLSRGRYDVREKKSVKKRPRGLKAMESMESDSE